MSEEQPSNAVLLEKIAGLKELGEQSDRMNREAHERLLKHLDKLNGQVAKNTQHRIQVRSYWKVVAFIITTPGLIAIFTLFLS